MRIGMILAKPFPSDIRVEKEAKALVGAGFGVGLLAEHTPRDSTLRETAADGLQIQRAAVPAASLWERNVKGLTLVDKRWLKPIEEFVTTFQPSVLHVHDFPLIRMALRIAQAHGLPVVADLHENYPAAVKVWRTGLPALRRFKDGLLRSYPLWRWYERRLLPQCAHILVVVPEAAERLSAYGLPKARVTVVSNTEDETTFSPGEVDAGVVDRYRGKWMACYLGGLGPERGIDTALQAVPLAAPEIPGFVLAIVGVQNQHDFDHLKQMAGQLGAQDQVDVVRWQPSSTARGYIAASSACLVPYIDSEHTHTTVPHKLFQYMLSGKPVVVSDVRPLRRIVQETNAGLVFEAGDPASLAQALLTLYKTPGLAATLGDSGRQAALGPYAWRHDAQRLVEVYRGLEASATGQVLKGHSDS